ncbi:hypothetical protein BT69DRAFT_1288476 [Atractiella rhizophila]|nr:hypothetical protein BT69DRAFT_1288476 [Atractiella rhizophila]
MATEMGRERGEKTLRTALEVYVDGGGERELDTRLRVGEALDRVVARMGEAVVVHLHTLLPPLLETLKSSKQPTTLRISTLNILSTLIIALPPSSLSSNNLSHHLLSTALDILELETVLLRPEDRRKKTILIQEVRSPESELEEDEEEEERAKWRREEDTPNPISTDSKHPALRRAAIHFVARLFASSSNALNEQIAEALEPKELLPKIEELRLGTERKEVRVDGREEMGGMEWSFPRELLERTRRVLGFVEEMDRDEVVRGLAGEVQREIEGQLGS